MDAVQSRAIDALARIDPFERAPRATLEAIADEAGWRLLAPGDVLVEADTEAREVGVVVEGALRVEVVAADGTRTPIAELGPGSVVGEVALLLGGRRTASVVADRESIVVDLSAAGFTRLLADAPEIAVELTSRATRRLREAQLAGHLTQLFTGLHGDALDDVLAAVDHVQVSAGERLFAEGDVADAAYVILSGRLRAGQTGADGTRAPLAEMGAGELVGELALLDEGRRGADVVAVRDSAVARLPRAVFDRLVTEHPAAMFDIARSLVARSRDPWSGRRSAGQPLSVAVIPHSADIDVRLFTTQLVDALGHDAFHIWSARADSLLHQPGIAQSGRGDHHDARLTHWLHEAEQDHRFLVYEADATWTTWTERACRQADEIVIVADADATDRSPGTLEAALDRTDDGIHAPRRTLVLLQDPGVDRPVDTAAWLDARRADRHVHVRRSSRRDVGRLARVLAGTATGLVLSGGGARGAGHLGVIRALHRAGVEIDAYGGTSMGSVMAMVGAAEWPDDELVPTAAAILSGLLDYTLPLVSLLKGGRISSAIADATAGRDIEDLWLDFFCISTNLTRQTEVVHRRGDLNRAVRASVSLPGVLPPVAMGDDLHIDGGSMNNLPIDRMREWNPTGRVIAVDVAPPRGPSAKADLLAVSGWGQLAGKVVPGRRAARVPGMIVTMLGSTVVAAMRDRHRHVADGLADLYLDLDLRGHGLLDFEAVAEIAEAGYEAAMPRIEAWLADPTGETHAALDPA